ncbi:VWA domain-containing protein [Geomonas sp. RF6]|uniref:VWA domain-containing protein n=1 Tax=Geomonas sp. RF6 TaxID=2897342 RepID=UPI001E612566|nr:VWA domain-containing protein [Geomonas sp. RF6]UFS69552.1 VWA domain-containing protein [Geomonas sp. RF6]
MAVVLIIAALCRPQWGAVAETRQAKGIDIVIALDVSRSMGADDAVPTRLAAAKEAVADLVAGLIGDRIGLIAFAGSAFTVCPLTSDYALFNSVLSDAGPGTIPLGGTSLAAALEEAARAFPPREGGGRVLVVISDGEDHGPDPAAAAARLRQEGILICPVAVGSLQGGLIPEEKGTFHKDRRGMVVKSRLEPASLQRIAAAGGGKVVELEKGARQLAALYRTELSSLEQKTSATTRQRIRERFQIPLTLAVGLLAAEPLLGFRRRR